MSCVGFFNYLGGIITFKFISFALYMATIIISIIYVQDYQNFKKTGVKMDLFSINFNVLLFTTIILLLSCIAKNITIFLSFMPNENNKLVDTLSINFYFRCVMLRFFKWICIFD